MTAPSVTQAETGAAPVPAARAALIPPAELARLRADFPVLTRTVHGKPLVYLDSGATSQRPETVLDTEFEFLARSNAAVHRGAHALAEEATEAFESAREAVSGFVGRRAEELVWTRNATEGINLVAHGLASGAADLTLRPGDEVLVTEMEHHANLVPWQLACARSGATLRWVGLTDEGRLRLDGPDGLAGLVTDRTKVVAFAHVSNVLGTVNPVAEIVAAARSVGAITVLDACQSMPHQRLDLAALDVDLAVFSAHKALGPNGIGALAGRLEVLEKLPPMNTGGSMVELVTMETATFRDVPQRFEAGTQAVSQAVAWHAAVRYLSDVGMDQIAAHEHALAAQLLAGIADLPGIRILGPAEPVDRSAAVAFAVDGVHPHDVGQYLDDAGIAVRVGHHCAQPVHRRFGVNASTRASAYLYNSPDDVDALLSSLAGVREYFGVAR